MCGTAAELAEMRNKIRLLQADASAGPLVAATGGPPENGQEDTPFESQTLLGEEDEDQSTSPQRRRIRSAMC